MPALQFAKAFGELLEVLLPPALGIEVEREQVGRVGWHSVGLDHLAEAAGERLGMKLVVHDEHRPFRALEAQLQHQPGLACLRRGDDVHHFASAKDVVDEDLPGVREIAEHFNPREVPLPLRKFDGLLLPDCRQGLPPSPEAVSRQGC